MCPGAGLEGRLRSVSPTPLAVFMCRTDMHGTLLLRLTSCFCSLLFHTYSVGVLFVLFVHFLPQLCMHTVIFSPLEFPCILLSRCKHFRTAAKGHRSQAVSGGASEEQDRARMGQRPMSSSINSLESKADRNASLCPVCVPTLHPDNPSL